MGETIPCEQCGEPFEPQSLSARFGSQACRNAASRAREGRRSCERCGLEPKALLRHKDAQGVTWRVCSDCKDVMVEMGGGTPRSRSRRGTGRMTA